jgi:hypothetical protein
LTTSSFSLKGLLLGTVLCLVIGVVAPYFVVFKYHWIGFNASSPGVIFFFAAIIIINIVVGFLSQRFGLSKADLILIYCMLLMAVTVPTWGLMFFLIGTIVYPYYYDTPENRFAELFHDIIPAWIVPQDLRAIKGYYEGIPKGEEIPWEAWFEPLGYWFALIVAMGFMLICVSAILHRQWSQHERLAYPMMQMPIGMLEDGDSSTSRIAPLFKSKLMWIGFLIPFVLLSLKGLNLFYPAVPEINLGGSLQLFRGTLSLPISVTFAYIGFLYLASLDLSFSIWFFYVLCRLQEGTFNILGIATTEKLSAYEAYPQAADLTHQQTGAVIVFVLFGLWAARYHLRDVLAKAWNPGRSDIDDSQELLRYRTAVIGFAASFVFVGAWLWRSGVPLILVPILLVVSLLFFILVARVVATAGVPSARSPIVPAYFLISGFGTSMLGAKGLVALTFTFIWQGESRTSPMVACSNGLKLAELVKGSKRILFWGFIIALVTSLAASAYTTLSMAYAYGAINLNLLGVAGGHGWPYTAPTILAMPEANMRGWLFKGIGGVIQGLLMWAQMRWFWWPLHPIGFTIAVGWLTSSIWFSALIAWLLKAIILHVGGGKLFQTLKPLFLGLILGEVMVGGVWAIIYSLTVENGRVLSTM